MAIQTALNVLGQSIQVQTAAAKTHQIVWVTGWNSSVPTRQAIAKYLVGLRLSAVNAALQIRAELTDTPASRAEVIGNVEAIVGANGAGLTKEQIERTRNPWIAEGLWHLCLALAQQLPAIHPPGKVIALSLPHAEATEHGIDVATIYDSGGTLGISIVECKAYQNNPDKAISDAGIFFRKVDRGVFSLKLRMIIQRMRADLSAEIQNRISAELWRQMRCYMPNPHYDSVNAVDWSNPRPSFKKLDPDASRIIIMPHASDDFNDFFNSISLEMLTFARSL